MQYRDDTLRAVGSGAKVRAKLRVVKTQAYARIATAPVVGMTPDGYTILGGSLDTKPAVGVQCGRCGGRCTLNELPEFVCGRAACPLGV